MSANFIDTAFSVASLAPNTTLLGSNIKEAALVDQWSAFTDSELNAPGRIIFQLLIGAITPYTKPVCHQAERTTRVI